LKILVILFPPILIFGIYAILFSALYLLRKYRQKKGDRPPFTDNFLRSPGESVNRRIMEINDKLTENLVLLITMPVLFYATYISLLHFGNSRLSTFTTAFYILAGIGLIAYYLFKLIKMLNSRRSYQLGYEGEIAVGQELNQLMRDGYYVYHDFPADKYNIDHVVVGTSGVFAVETKARSKATSAGSTSDYKVTYDGNRLHFPKGTDVKSIEQAKRQAKSLSGWLSKATGEHVAVRPVLALPGWYVERTSSNGIPVINPKNFRSIAKPIEGNILSERMITRIVHQLEQKCRDIIPGKTTGSGNS